METRLFQCWCFLIEDASQRIIFMLQAHLSKGVEKNMPKAWNFTKYKSCHRSFHHGQVENLETSKISEIFFREFLIRVFDFGRRAKSKTRKKETRNNFSEISDFSEFSICHFFIFFLIFFSLFINFSSKLLFYICNYSLTLYLINTIRLS